MTVAFLGVGLMGRPMILNLARAGFTLLIWNRTRAKAESLRDVCPNPERVQVAATPAEAIAGAQVVITMLENGPVVREVAFSDEALRAWQPGTLFIDMSSIPPSMAREHAAWLVERACLALDAPVSGGTVGAEAATLSIMVGGAAVAFEQALPLLSVLGQPRRMGEAGTGQVAKLANQAIVGITIGAVAEALLLARAAGADPVAVREALLGGFAASRILELHGQRMIERRFQPGARARVQLKDLDMIRAAAADAGLSLPLVNQTGDLYRTMVEAGLGFDQLDHSALLLEIERRNACLQPIADV